jgi:hypothetical protein
MSSLNRMIIRYVLFLILFYAFLYAGFKKPKEIEIKHIEEQKPKVIKEKDW